MKLSVVIPAFNESKNIVSEVQEVLAAIHNENIKHYEILVIDDHSTDNTYKAVTEIKNSKVNCIRLSKQGGSHTAIRAGLQNSTGDLVLCISADGQDDPEVLGKMLAKMSSGSNIVWALRKGRDEGFLQKTLAVTFYKILSNLSNSDKNKIDLAHADFFMIDRKVADAVNKCSESNTSLMGLLIWLGFNQDSVEYNRRQRKSGRSKWNFNSRMKLAKDWLIAFSGIPLTYISYVGFLTATVGLIYAAVILCMALFGYITPGWAETTILILVIGGIQMTMLGLLGEYLWRGLEETRKRPLYFVEKDSFEKTINELNEEDAA